MNKISEIIEKKQRKTITEETIYETYARTICVECENRKNDKEMLIKVIKRYKCI